MRWRGYGHDRLHVDDEVTGLRLGWRDEKTGEIHIDDAGNAPAVKAALLRWDATGR